MHYETPFEILILLCYPSFCHSKTLNAHVLQWGISMVSWMLYGRRISGHSALGLETQTNRSPTPTPPEDLHENDQFPPFFEAHPIWEAHGNRSYVHSIATPSGAEEAKAVLKSGRVHLLGRLAPKGVGRAKLHQFTELFCFWPN